MLLAVSPCLCVSVSLCRTLTCYRLESLIARGVDLRGPAHPAADEHLDFDATVLRAARGRSVIRDRLGLAVAHRRDEASQRNLVRHREVLHDGLRALLAELEVARGAPRSIRV